jgi:4a-hydroxytetrahydrobiopterin dehydratase
VAGTGWRYLQGVLAVSVPVRSLAQASEAAAAAVAACGDDADGHLRVDLRPDRVELSVQTRALGVSTGRDPWLAHRIDSALAGLGLAPAGATSGGATSGGATSAGSPRPVQVLELAIDAMDIPAIRPFWKAVLGYADEPGSDGGLDAIVDPAGQLPAIWFQQMDSPRPQRNRIHLDITVAHDEAGPRVHAALAAGGRLVDDSFAPSYWVMADPEGNEACVCTWTDREEPER